MMLHCVFVHSCTVQDRKFPPVCHYNGPAHLWSSLPTTTGRLQHPGHKEGSQHHQGPHPPTAYTVLLWQMLQERESKDNQTDKQLLSIRLLNHFRSEHFNTYHLIAASAHVFYTFEQPKQYVHIILFYSLFFYAESSFLSF